MLVCYKSHRKQIYYFSLASWITVSVEGVPLLCFSILEKSRIHNSLWGYYPTSHVSIVNHVRCLSQRLSDCGGWAAISEHALLMCKFLCSVFCRLGIWSGLLDCSSLVGVSLLDLPVFACVCGQVACWPGVGQSWMTSFTGPAVGWSFSCNTLDFVQVAFPLAKPAWASSLSSWSPREKMRRSHWSWLRNCIMSFHYFLLAKASHKNSQI